MTQNKESLRRRYLSIIGKREKALEEPISVFCKKQGISPATFYRWKIILGTPASRKCPIERFVPVTIVPPLAATDSGKNSFDSYRYDFQFPNGATLQITGFLNTADVSELVRTVGKLPL